MMRRLLLVLTISVSFTRSLFAADWPQFRGPDRNGISPETGLLKTWPEKGPPLVWTYDQAGIGYSSPAIVGDRIYLMGARDNTEFVFALDASNGRQIWAVKIGPMFDWKGNSWNAGPSATPTVAGDLVFALGGGGEMVCATTAGKEVWRKSMIKDLGGEVNAIGGGAEQVGWGFTWSPLVDGGQLICVPGSKEGLLAALDPKTGAVKWWSKQLGESATYSSPLVAEVDGVRQYIEMTLEGVAGFAAKDGALLWQYKRNPAYDDVVIPTPVYSQGFVFTTVGLSKASCDLVKLTRDGAQFKADKVYSSKVLLNDHGGVVLVNGHIFGYSGPSASRKQWVCLDFKTGKVLWSERGKLSGGSIIGAEGRLYLYGEDDGTAVLLEASPEGWKEQGRFDPPQKSTLKKSKGKFWTHPVIANGKLYLRDQNLLFCYDIKAK